MSGVNDHMSSAVHSAFIVFGIGKIAYSHYKKWMAPTWAAQKIIREADSIARVVMEEVNNGIDFELHHVTEVVSSQTMDVIENNTVKRRVRSKAPFRAYLVKAGKAKFGLVKYTPANKMCVRKYLYDLCVSHGVLARHIGENVDLACELVFIPTASELQAMAMQESAYGKYKNQVKSRLGRAEDCT
jgi:hypothetical protein